MYKSSFSNQTNMELVLEMNDTFQQEAWFLAARKCMMKLEKHNPTFASTFFFLLLIFNNAKIFYSLYFSSNIIRPIK